jgi:GH25 family lysozyme M1 (1,4-beta-N-acetylmuramidase)
VNFDNHTLIITDVSFWQDDNSTQQKINFQQMRGEGAVGTILRGGQNTWIDSDFQDYKNTSKGVLPRGYYWFYDSRSDPLKQAVLWQSAIGNDYPELGLWFDFEESYHGQYSGEKYWKEFVLAMEAFYPNIKTKGIYTARWWWDAQTVKDHAFWSKYPLWVAQYGVRQEDVVLPRSWAGKEALLWQFTAHGDGIKYGVESLNIDLNLFNGGIEKYKSFFGLESNPTDPPGEPMPDYIELKSLSGSNHSIRRQTAYPQVPHIMGATFSTLLAGTVARVAPTDFYLYASDITYNGVKQAFAGDKWWKIDSNGETGWIAEIHKGVKYLSATLIQEPDPVELPDLPVTIEIGDDATYAKQVISIVLKPK